MPPKPQHITITKPAAEQLLQISKDEKHTEHRLAIMADGQGGFCLEYRDEWQSDETPFMVEGVTEIEFGVSQLTLWQIGGSTVDFREGVFKLDLYEGTCCKGTSKECACSAS